MGPDDEDFDEHEPLPDPTMRTWRHPSELAAVAAMAAHPDGPPPAKRRLAVGSLVLGTALGGVAVLSVLLSTGLVGTETTAPRVQFRNPPTTAAAPSTTAVTVPTSTAPPTTSPTATTSTTPMAPAPVTPLGSELETGELPVVPSEAIVAVLLDPHDDTPDSTGVVLEGHVVTSASAIGDATEVTLVVNGTSHLAFVVGRDPFTDIAVVSPPPDAVLHELRAAAPVGPGAPVALVATDGLPEPIIVVGRITGSDQTGRAENGHALIGLLTTSVRLPEPGAGSLLLNPRGELVGMVVDNPEHVAAAVPEPTLRRVTRSLLDTGHPAAVWIGVSALDRGDGVRLTAVAASGPAFAAGLRPGDRLLSLDGITIDGVGTFIAALRAHQPGEQVAVTFERRGEVAQLELTTAAPPPRPAPDVEERAAD